MLTVAHTQKNRGAQLGQSREHLHHSNLLLSLRKKLRPTGSEEPAQGCPDHKRTRFEQIPRLLTPKATDSSRPMLLKLECAQRSPAGPVRSRFSLSRSGVGPRFCISSQCSGDVHVAGRWTTHGVAGSGTPRIL